MALSNKTKAVLVALLSAGLVAGTVSGPVSARESESGGNHTSSYHENEVENEVEEDESDDDNQKPEKVTKTKAERGKDKIVFSWVTPDTNGARIKHYVVRVYDPAGKIVAVKKVSKSHNSVKINKLKKNTVYTFTVETLTDNGSSKSDKKKYRTTR